MAPGKPHGQAPVVVRSGSILIHVHDLAALEVVLLTVARLGDHGRPTQRAAQCGDAGDGGGSLPHELVGRATQKATQLLCAATGRHANGLQQAMAPVRRNLRPSLAKDLRELHVADAVCRHATAERFSDLVSELQESLGVFTDLESTALASTESGAGEASTGDDGASCHQRWCTDDQKSELKEVAGDLPAVPEAHSEGKGLGETLKGTSHRPGRPKANKKPGCSKAKGKSHWVHSAAPQQHAELRQQLMAQVADLDMELGHLAKITGAMHIVKMKEAEKAEVCRQLAELQHSE